MTYSPYVGVGDFPPLGEYKQLRRWSGRSIPWGPDGQWSAAFGSGAGVLDQLVELINDFPRRVADRYPSKAEAFPVALGCVPWFNSVRVADALMRMGSHCICVDKSSLDRSVVQALLTHDRGVANYFIPDLRFAWRIGHDGSPAVIGPGTPIEESEEYLEPVRVVDWAHQRGKHFPILHAKLAVLCAAWRWENDGGGYDDHLTPLVAWCGSANWTETASRHIEFGAWTTDEDLCTQMMHFLADVIRFSEAPTSETAGPEPDLAEAEWDDAAFAEYAAEWGYDDPDAHQGGPDSS